MKAPIEAALRREIARLVKLPPDSIALDASLGELGVDSLGYVDIASALSREFGVELHPEVLFEHGTLADTVACVLDLRGDAPEAAAPAAASLAASTSTASCDEKDIAIIGTALRVPGANDLDALWHMVLRGQPQWSPFPADRLTNRERREALPPYARGGFVPDAAEFDARFFGISAREALAMDPQQRLLLECAWHAFEDAGLAAERLAGSNTSVFVGASSFDYYETLLKTPGARTTHVGTGISHAILANRVSQFFNLTGASEAIDSACASSMVALWRGVESLRRGESGLALVAGVNLLGSLTTFGLLSDAGMLSPHGECKPFDDEASGYVRGEGVVCAVLKPARAALADGDRILAVIKGGAVRHSGRTQSLTAPNPQAQTDVIRAALEDARVEPTSIGYLEAHGTGTKLGDPVEIQGLKKAFVRKAARKGEPPAPHFFIGSIKSQVGHLEAAAGLMGVLKTVAVLREGVIPPSRQVQSLNRFITLEDAAFRIPTEPCPWDDVTHDGVRLPTGPRRAAVSSFGFGGSNTHVVLEQAPPLGVRPRDAAAPGPRLFVLSAKSAEALSRACGVLAAHVQALSFDDAAAEALALDDMAYTLRGRSALPHRFAVVASTRDALASALLRFALEQVRVDGAFAHAPQRDARADEGTEPSAETPIDPHDLQALAERWVQGRTPPLDTLLPRGHARRITLPGYPFLRERFWPAESARAPSEASADAPWPAAVCYQAEWAPQALPAPSTSTDDDGLWAVWVAGPRGQRVAELCAALVTWPVRTYDCGVASTLTQLSTQACPEQARAFLDLTALDADHAPTFDAPTKLALLSRWIGGALRRGEPLRLLQATCGLRSGASLAGAAEAALYEHLGAEYKRVRSQTVDFAPYEAGAIAQRVIDELRHGSCDALVAYRGDARHVRRMVPLNLAAHAATTRAAEVAMITGATGDIGRQLAADLAARGCRALLLTGRSALTPEKDAALQALRAQGVAITWYRGELTDAAALREAVDRFRHAHGAITHVFHCAGAVDSETPAFVQKTRASIQRVMAPKVHALQVLHDVFAAQPPRAFVLFSSVSAVAPTLAAGVLDYAAANHYLDLFAQHQRAQGHPQYLSVQWTRWRELGLARHSRHGQDHGLALDARICLDTLQRLLAQQAHLPAAVCVLAEGDRVFDAAPVAVAAPKPVSPRVNATTAPAASAEVLAQVRRLVAQELERPESQLDERATFEELGIDSIILMGLIRQIESWLGQVIDPQQLMDCNSIAAVAAYLQPLISASGRTPAPAAALATHAAAPIPASAPVVMHRASPTPDEPFKVAVIGMACRFPGANDIGRFWHNLRHGVDSVAPIPVSRWDRHALYTGRIEPGRTISQWGGFIDDIETITPRLFGMSAEDAADVDPLIRLFTECSLAAAGDARLGAEGLKGRRVGVFAGARSAQYSSRIEQPGKQSITGIGQNFVSAYVSHLLDLRGPSLVLDTACSSSLAAIHLACQSLRCGEIEMALAGGVEVLLDEQPYLFLSASGALSPDGRCRTFDAQANGFVPGEGVGCVLLKPLGQALADGDPIYAVIAGSAMNNDGHTLGITTPGSAGQVDVIEQALGQAGVSPRAISYVEAHGTGTLIGDPIELQALTRAFEADPPTRCGVGSVKSNLGHLLSAAGVASFMKVALSLHQRTLPPTLHITQVNPRINFDQTPFFPVQQAQPWDGPSPLHAGISAFGFGKTNVHMVLTEAPATAPRPALDKPAAWPAGERVRAWHDARRPAGHEPAASGALLELTDLVIEESEA